MSAIGSLEWFEKDPWKNVTLTVKRLNKKYMKEQERELARKR